MRKEEKIWDRFSGIYDKVIEKDREVYKVMINKMLKSIGRDESVLEIATGTGVLAISLSEKIANITAIDFSEKMIKVARLKAEQQSGKNIKFDVQDACNLNFEDNQFDVIIISNALHIMPNPAKVLSEIKRVLKNNGRLIAPTFMHKKNKKAFLFFKIAGFVGFKTYHRWDETAFCDFLRKNGFNHVNSVILESTFNVAYATADIEKKM